LIPTEPISRGAIVAGPPRHRAKPLPSRDTELPCRCLNVPRTIGRPERVRQIAVLDLGRKRPGPRRQGAGGALRPDSTVRTRAEWMGRLCHRFMALRQDRKWPGDPPLRHRERTFRAPPSRDGFQPQGDVSIAENLEGRDGC
jgi:hypothetical protein